MPSTGRRLSGDCAIRRVPGLSAAEALLDQQALAGIGNVYKSEVLFIERVDPFALVGDLDDETLARLVDRARVLLLANRDVAARVTTGTAGGGPPSPAAASIGRPRGSRTWVYGRAGRPCRRCGTLIRVRRHGDLPRATYWCPRCQLPAGGDAAAQTVQIPEEEPR